MKASLKKNNSNKQLRYSENKQLLEIIELSDQELEIVVAGWGISKIGGSGGSGSAGQTSHFGR